MRSSHRGMTLIEVLVAFVILSLSMGVIMQIFFGGIRNARLAGGYSRAVFLAESTLASVGLEQPLVSGETTGQLSADLRWKVTIVPMEDDTGSEALNMTIQLYQVRVQVLWNDEGQQRRMELSSLRMGPKQ